MTANPKQELRELIERLSDEEARRLSAALRQASAAPVPSVQPLTEADVVLAEPTLPDQRMRPPTRCPRRYAGGVTKAGRVEHRPVDTSDFPVITPAELYHRPEERGRGPRRAGPAPPPWRDE